MAVKTHLYSVQDSTPAYRKEISTVSRKERKKEGRKEIKKERKKETEKERKRKTVDGDTTD
jgi:hypothetical protein